MPSIAERCITPPDFVRMASAFSLYPTPSNSPVNEVLLPQKKARKRPALISRQHAELAQDTRPLITASYSNPFHHHQPFAAHRVVPLRARLQPRKPVACYLRLVHSAATRIFLFHEAPHLHLIHVPLS